MSLKLYNSITREKEEFIPINPPYVGMYVCGPTVYSDVHLGNCRTFISFDIIYRYLLHMGYKVRYVRNITDVGHLENDADEGEDKIAKKARLEQLEPMEIVQRYTIGFHKVMEKFNTLSPCIEPTATGHIIEQIQMVRTILNSGYAYEVNGSVYFDVPKYNQEHNYGKLSGRNIEELYAGTRELDGQDEKRSSLDFAIWKKASPSHIMRWESPWGEGFPGWHLECSAMSTKYLGTRFDIHGGGMDLKFPHHECEIAQNKATNQNDGPKYWMHANMLTVNGARMGKSKGNSFLPEQLFSGDHPLLEKGYSPMTVKFFMLQAHYRSTLDFSNEALQASEKAYNKLMQAIETLGKLTASDQSTVQIEDLYEKCTEAMNDDFNTPIVIAHLFEGVKVINQVKEGKAKIDQKGLDVLNKTFHDFVFSIFGLKNEKISDDNEAQITTHLMELIMEIRKGARADRNFAVSDLIRDKLKEIGIVIKDGKESSEWMFEI